jgi:hypothetical protein
MSSPSHAEFSTISVPEGHIALVLLREENPLRSFYLEIPSEVIMSSCLKPRKYLVFLGWCIFGDEVYWPSNTAVVRLIPMESWMTRGYITMCVPAWVL